MSEKTFHQPPRNEERLFRNDEVSSSLLLSGAQRKTKESIWSLSIIGFSFAAYSLWLYFSESNLISSVEQGVCATLFFSLAFMAVRSPFKASLAGAVLYPILFAVEALLDPASVLQGLLVKGIIVAALIKGLLAAREARRLKKKLAGLQAGATEFP